MIASIAVRSAPSGTVDHAHVDVDHLGILLHDLQADALFLADVIGGAERYLHVGLERQRGGLYVGSADALDLVGQLRGQAGHDLQRVVHVRIGAFLAHLGDEAHLHAGYMDGSLGILIDARAYLAPQVGILVRDGLCGV